METTFGRFYSEMRSFISDLFRNPVGCNVSSYLKERGLTKKKLVNDLISRGIISRNEAVKDSTDSDFDKPTYTVKYKLSKDGFEKKMKRLYTKYFEKNTKPEEDEELNEEGGATTCDSVGGQFLMPLTKKPISRQIAEGRKRVFMTEAQIRYIKSHV